MLCWRAVVLFRCFTQCAHELGLQRFGFCAGVDCLLSLVVQEAMERMPEAKRYKLNIVLQRLYLMNAPKALGEKTACTCLAHAVP